MKNLFLSLSAMLLVGGCASSYDQAAFDNTIENDPDMQANWKNGSPPSAEAVAEETAKGGAKDLSQSSAGQSERVMKTDEDQKITLTSGGPGETLAVITVVDEHEIAVGRVAEKKNISQPVRDYAEMLVRSHEQNLEKTKQVGEQIGTPPLSTPAVEKMRAKGEKELAKVESLEGEQFSRAFLNAMVKGHSEALDLIDKQLLPKATNETLKEHLTETRGAVAAHLEQAKLLQGESAVGAPGDESETSQGAGAKEQLPTNRENEDKP
jgi:putative membrane protein